MAADIDLSSFHSRTWVGYHHRTRRRDRARNKNRLGDRKGKSRSNSPRIYRWTDDFRDERTAKEGKTGVQKKEIKMKHCATLGINTKRVEIWKR